MGRVFGACAKDVMLGSILEGLPWANEDSQHL